MELTLDECIRLNSSLMGAMKTADYNRAKDILSELKAAGVKNKLKFIAESKLGATVAKLAKFDADAGVKASAAAVKDKWAAAAAASKKPSGGSAPSEVKPEPAAKMEEEVAKPEVKPEVAPEPPAAKAEEPAPSDAKLEPAAKVEEPVSLKREESLNQQVTWRAVRPTGEQIRDMVLSKLQECFDKGKVDNERFLRGQLTDTAAMAEEAEANMYAVFNGASKEYKARFRSLMFNLKDPKNPTFIKTVITGQIHTDDLATMEVREMASEELKKARIDAAEHAKMALMDDRAWKNYTGKTTQDGILKCPKCKSMKTEYVEVQTRSADEPTTKKCTCNNCDYRWKFC